MELGSERKLSPRVTVEAILLQSDHNNLRIKLDETAKPFWIPRSGVKMTTKKGAANGDNAVYVNLKLTENKAVNYGLI